MEAQSKKIVLANGWRTPIGHINKSLSSLRAEDLMEATLRKVIADAGIDPMLYDGAIIGWVGQGSHAPNIARVACLKAGLPERCVAFTEQVNCVSGLETVASAARRILTGEGELYFAGGTESMSQMPYAIRGDRRVAGLRTLEDIKKNWGGLLSNPNVEVGDCLLEGLVDPVKKLNMAATAEILAQLHGITREEQDAYAVESYRRAIEALDKNVLSDHVFPVQHAGQTLLSEDENPRMRAQFVQDPSKLHKMTLLFDTAAFTMKDFYREYAAELPGKQYVEGKTKGTITPFNACPRSDGAAAVLVTTEAMAKKLKLRIQAELIGWSFAGIDPAQMGKSPAYSTADLLKKLGLKMQDIGVIDLHEAFAAGCLAIFKIAKKEWKHPWEELFQARVVNPNGGSLALGHPLAASGTRVILNAISTMQKKKDVKYAMAAACAAGGMGCSMAFRRYEG